MGRMMALATRYDVSTQVASSTVAAILLAMSGSDTLTTVVSSTSMKVANMTEMAIIQGFTCGASCRAAVARTPPLFHDARWARAVRKMEPDAPYLAQIRGGT